MRAPPAVSQYFRSCADCGVVLLFLDSDSSHFGRGLWELSESGDTFYHSVQMLIINLDVLYLSYFVMF